MFPYVYSQQRNQTWEREGGRGRRKGGREMGEREREGEGEGGKWYVEMSS